MNTFLLFILSTPFIVSAIRCPQAYYTNVNALPLKNSSSECEFFSRFCTRTILTNNTTFHNFQQVVEKRLLPGVYYECSEGEPANFEGDGVSIQNCNYDDCTTNAHFVKNILCGDLVTSDPSELPTRSVHCGSNGTCFKAVATKSGRIQVGDTVYSYSKGATYGCGEGKCPVNHNGDSIQINCCTGDNCNFQVVQQNSACSYCLILTLISFVYVLL